MPSPNTQGDLTTPTGILPLIRWPGGKRAILRHLLDVIPEAYGRYYEPFLGGGALFFRLAPASATLSDTNYDLINCYAQIKDNPKAVMTILSDMRNDKQTYYSVRASRPTSPTRRAARLLFLTAYSFNGIYRTNLRGEFNVPYGSRPGVYYDLEKLTSTSAALQGVELLVSDFSKAIGSAQSGDLIYFDPPYTLAHHNNGFVKYNATLFSWQDQLRLAALARKLVKRGCGVVVSNADHASIHELYNGFDVITVERSSRIAASNGARKRVSECIFFRRGR